MTAKSPFPALSATDDQSVLPTRSDRESLYDQPPRRQGTGGGTDGRFAYNDAERVNGRLIGGRSEHSRSLGHVPLIDVNPRGDKARAEELRTEARRLKHLGFQRAEQVRYNERTAGERVNGRLKDEFGGRHVRVRGAAKVMCHCMFGMLALTADQLLRLVT